MDIDDTALFDIVGYYKFTKADGTTLQDQGSGISTLYYTSINWDEDTSDETAADTTTGEDWSMDWDSNNSTNSTNDTDMWSGDDWSWDMEDEWSTDDWAMDSWNSTEDNWNWNDTMAMDGGMWGNDTEWIRFIDEWLQKYGTSRDEMSGIMMFIEQYWGPGFNLTQIYSENEPLVDMAWDEYETMEKENTIMFFDEVFGIAEAFGCGEGQIGEMFVEDCYAALEQAKTDVTEAALEVVEGNIA